MIEVYFPDWSCLSFGLMGTELQGCTDTRAQQTVQDEMRRLSVRTLWQKV